MNDMTTIDLKVNDVFRFRFSAEEIKKRPYPWHCFDGQLVVRARKDGSLYLVDTYWAFGSYGDSKSFSLEAIENIGTIEYVCNLDDVEKMNEWENMYYSDEDIFNLSYQAGCYKYWVKKKGAVRSLDKMLKSVTEKIEQAERDIKSAEWRKSCLEESKAKIESGDSSVYI